MLLFESLNLNAYLPADHLALFKSAVKLYLMYLG